MQRRHKFIWMKGWEQINYTQDGRFDKPKIQKNEKTYFSNCIARDDAGLDHSFCPGKVWRRQR